MPTPPSLITVPVSLSYRSINGRATPLTNLELDGNFAYLENLTERRLLISDFTSTNIVNKLNTDPATSAAGGLNVSLLRGSAPSTANSANTIALRDASGDLYASIVHATTFNGKAVDAASADGADKLNTSRDINGVAFNGTTNITIYDSTKVAKTGDSMTGNLTLASSIESRASLTIPHGTAPATLVNGDIWTTTVGQFNRIAGITRRVAYIDSSISGTASNVTGIVQIINGGTGTNDAAEARTNLGAAASGVNSDITRLSGLTTAISVSQGGTGLTTPGAAGNVLTSTGTGTWVSAAPVYTPSGAVMAFAMTTVPTGWLECNGEAISRTVYPGLFDTIGTRYGAGNGTTTFNLPDLRGMFVRGWDHGRAIDGGRAIASYQADENKAHNHLLPGDDQLSLGNNHSGWTSRSAGGFPYDAYSTNSGSGRIWNTSDTGGSETRPKNIAMMYCIKI